MRKKFRPLLLLMGYPCTNHCIFNRNINFTPEQLQQRQDLEKDMRKEATEAAHEQMDNNCFFLLENHLTATSGSNQR